MTTRTKIAPTLTGIVSKWPGVSGAPMRRQLRALLAVARAAIREQEESQRIWGDDYERARSAEPTWAAMDRALARLDRVSRGAR